MKDYNKVSKVGDSDGEDNIEIIGQEDDVNDYDKNNETETNVFKMFSMRTIIIGIAVTIGAISIILLILWGAGVYDNDNNNGDNNNKITPKDLKDLRTQLYTTFENSNNHFGDVTPLIATTVRLAFHDCGGPIDDDNNTDTISICDGCIDPTNLANHGGLWNGAVVPLEEVYQKYKYHKIMSRADFWATAAIMGLEYASSGEIPNLGFYFGRKECESSPDTDEGNAQLPNPEAGWEDTFDWFHLHFDLTIRETVTLIGAHTFGRGHANVSGYINAWVAQPQILDNVFYADIIAQSKQWHQKVVRTGKIQWVDDNDAFLMLNADMCLYIEISDYLNSTDGGSVSCNFIDDVLPLCPIQNNTADIVQEFADNNTLWLIEFADVFQKMTLTGYDDDNDDSMYFVESEINFDFD